MLCWYLAHCLHAVYLLPLRQLELQCLTSRFLLVVYVQLLLHGPFGTSGLQRKVLPFLKLHSNDVK